MSGAGKLEGVAAPTTALGLHLSGIFHAHEGMYEEAEAAFLHAAEAEGDELRHACEGRENRRSMVLSTISLAMSGTAASRDDEVAA